MSPMPSAEGSAEGQAVGAADSATNGAGNPVRSADSDHSHGPSSSPDQDRSLPSAQIDVLKIRARLLQKMRAFFDRHGYLEVQTPTLSRDSVVDAYLEPFVTHGPAHSGRVCESSSPVPDPGTGEAFYLQTSPEFAMKRLLVAGSGSIYQITPAYRKEEQGQWHNPEFTMVEWYWVGADYQQLMHQVADLVSALLQSPAPRFLSYREAFRQYARLDPWTLSDSALAQAAAEAGWLYTDSSRDELLNYLLACCVEPHLGVEQPDFLYDYPASQAALAQVRIESDDVKYAERFELYYRGLELCNGYHELTDAEELIRRAAEQNRIRVSQGYAPIADESQLVQAMRRGLPPCSGVALGFDRLVAIAAGAQSLAEVLPFAWDRA